jgi:hypothetical protein
VRGDVKIDLKPAKLVQRVASFLSRRAASPRDRSAPIIVGSSRRRHPPLGAFATVGPGLKGIGSATDLSRAGRTVAGRGTSDRPPGNCDTSGGVAIGAGRPPALAALRMELSPRPEDASLVTLAARPTSGPHLVKRGTQARTAPTGEVGTARALALAHRRIRSRAAAPHDPCVRDAPRLLSARGTYP